MKNLLALIFNDVHLRPGNEQEIINSVRHMINYAEEKACENIIFAGDLFDSRAFQRQSVLLAFDTILDMFINAGITLHMFPGNHDKTIYKSFDSFLDIYRYHPNIKFNRAVKDIVIDGISITLLPFFSDEMIVPMIEEHKGGDVLISHFEMNGSTHLGRVSEGKAINRTMLKKWKKTYLGHYHNTHEINEDIIHMPSFRQSNFGEDNNKGFTALYDDLSYEVIKGVFTEFKKVLVNINDICIKELKELIKAHKNADAVVRFEITGEESKLKALDKSIFKDTGIDVKIKYDAKYDFDEVESPIVIQKYDEEQVTTSFKSFCEEKGYDMKEGMKYLEEFLKQKDSNG